MTTPPASAPARHEIAAIARQDWGRLVASLIRLVGDFQLAEDCLQDALRSALRHWTRMACRQIRPVGCRAARKKGNRPHSPVAQFRAKVENMPG
ncbi:MAG: hypothetical protein R3D29_14700 [Nitratireductor sp.]